MGVGLTEAPLIGSEQRECVGGIHGHGHCLPQPPCVALPDSFDFPFSLALLVPETQKYIFWNSEYLSNAICNLVYGVHPLTVQTLLFGASFYR